ncbi:hypothetical protein NE237_028586 [Protea cynaroides]|uniref:Endoglucanase n=1 Tax=Protea cynaroides TaxID=273540 RepID=A0A9Q0JT01_9MAGN|nr:hypothetical protein NE237_028586 [Protea cynaroides]
MAIIVAWLALFNGLFVAVNGGLTLNYKEALTKSIIFLEAQRSGKLPRNTRLSWRGDSGLEDGKEANVDLVGGYYDAGDNVKFGFPMAFTITTLSWGAAFYRPELQKAGELQNVMDAIKWGTDFFLKASAKRNHLWVQVGDPVQDHQCWVRPENMNTPRHVMEINENTPGSEIAGETSAALASASIVFRRFDRVYSRRLLNKAKMLFEFARTHKGTFDGECPFYCSYSGYNLYFEGEKSLETFKSQADSFVCSVLPESPFHQVYVTPGGLIHMRDGANSQYAAGDAYLFTVYGDLLTKHNQKVTCGDKQFDGTHLLAFGKKQMDYLLGDNPRGRSYMVGFGNSPPTRAHHRGSSVPVLSPNAVISCPMTFVNWFSKDSPNPNELTGAIVGGPDRNDNFVDQRWASSMLEPTTYTNSLAIGVLARFSGV